MAAGVVGLALVAGLMVSNFMGGETKIERRIERLYALDDPPFTDELGVLLCPPFLAGNKINALLNGDQIFPPMLAAIRGAKETGLPMHRLNHRPRKCLGYRTPHEVFME